jgi:hypothetical protein
MILQLMKRDRAWKIALFLAPLTAVLLLVGRATSIGDDFEWTFQLANVQTLLILSGIGCGHGRATLFEAALPIYGRQLFLARLLSRLAMVWMTVSAAILVILSGRDTGWPQVLELLECGALYTLAYLLPLSVRVRECAAPAGLVVALWAGLAATGALVWHFLPTGVGLAVFALAGALMLLRTWFAIPAGFEVAPIEAVGWIASPRSTRDAPTLAWWPIVRSAGFGMPLFLLPAGIFWGHLGGDFFFPFGMLVIFANVQVRQRTRWLYALPLSFRALGLITLGPALALLLGGAAIGRCFDTALPRDYSLYGGPRRQPPHDMDIHPNFEFWPRAPAGQAPVISAPWGETVRATTYRFLGITFYNPYSVDARNSERFFKWQFERATAAVYGRAIPVTQYGAAQDAGLAPVTWRPRIRLLLGSAGLVAMLLLVYLIEWTRSHRVRRLPQGLREGLPFWSLFAVVAIDGIGLWFCSFPLGTTLVHAAVLQLSNLLPDNLVAVTAAALVPVVGMCWLVERQFRKSELLGPIRPPSALGRLMQAE